MAYNKFKFRANSKLLDFGNIDVADVAGIIIRDVQAIHKLEETMNTDNIDAECATEEIVSLALQLNSKASSYYSFEAHIQFYILCLGGA